MPAAFYYGATAFLCFLVFILVFRRQMGGLLDRVKAGKAGSLAIDFGGQLGPESAEHEPTQKPSARTLEDAVKELAKEFPEELYTAADGWRNLVNEAATYKTWYHFERVYNAIYGSQIRLLRYLVGRGNEGATLGELWPFYLGTQARHPEYTFERYVEFLVNMGLVTQEPTAHRYVVPPLGQDFLIYLRIMDYDEALPL